MRFSSRKVYGNKALVFGYLKLYYERNAEMNGEGNVDPAAAMNFLINHIRTF